MNNVIYGLFDPKTNELRYIGKTIKGTEYRLREHLKLSSLNKRTHKNNWINKLIENNMLPIIEIIELHDNPYTLDDAEEFWIEYYKSIGCNLTNSTNGGKGSLGRVWNQESLDKLSKTVLAKGVYNFTPGYNKKHNVFINNIEHRECRNCQKFKTMDNFWFDKKKNKYQAYCRSCSRQKTYEWKAREVKLLPEDEYNKTRIPGSIAGGQATANSPTAKAAIAKKLSKAIIATCTVTGKTLEFASALKAKEVGFQNTNIGQAIKYNKPYRGYHWKFKT